MNLTKVKQVHETKNIKEVNDLLKSDWVLIGTYVNNGIIYILGRIKSEPQNIKFEFKYGADIKAMKRRNFEIKELEKQILDDRKRMVEISKGILVEII